MARTTRSTATVQEKDKSVETTTSVLPPSRTKSKSKKRKRDSVAEYEDQPVTKALRHDTGVDEDEQEEKPDLDGIYPQPLPVSADAFLDPPNAQQILDILEMCVLCRVVSPIVVLCRYQFQGRHTRLTRPSISIIHRSLRTHIRKVLLLSYPFTGAFKTSSTCSPRSCIILLQTCQCADADHTFQAAIQHLFPISSHSRSRSSTPGAQQLRFCNLALSLLDQVSKSSAPISLDIESPSFAANQDSSSSPVKRRKYALMQKLPSGEWWTSLNSDITLSQQERELRDVGTGHSELVSILPTPSTSSLPSDQPTLGSFAPKKASAATKLHPTKHRFISRGSFLDYGPFASFSPTFEQDGREVGRIGLGEVLLAERRNKQRAMSIETLQRKRLNEIHDQDVVMEDGVHSAQQAGENLTQTTGSDDWEMPKGLLTREQVESIKAALKNLDLEVAVQELLDRTAKALVRLEELQMQRLDDKASFRPVEVNSEEWDTGTSLKHKTAFQLSTITSSASYKRLSRCSDVSKTQVVYR
jgi:hypothetical protein